MTIDPETFLDARLRLSPHVVHRSFASETVVLNLETGRYHGLNPIGGQLLDILNDAPSVRDAAALVADRYDQDQAAVEADLLEFCSDLLERRLVEIVVDEAAI
jgi:hypothetical protein